MTGRRGRRATALAAVAVACGGCGIGLQDLPTPGGPGGPTYDLHATFANVLNLPIGAKVRDGVAVVGDVSTITAHHFAAQLTLTISRGVRVAVGTTAQVRFESPLGDDFVQLYPPPGATGGPFLGDGATIPESATSTAPTIEDTLTALAAVLNGSGLQQIEVIISQLNAALSGNTGDVRALLDDLDQLTGSLAGHTGDIDGALTAMDTLTAELAAGSGTIAEGLSTITPAVGTLAADNGALDNLVAAVNQVTATATQVADQSGQDTVQDIDALVPVVSELVGIDGQLGGDLADLTRFERTFPSVVPGNYLQLSLDATVDLEPPASAGTAAVRRTAGSLPATAFLSPGSAGSTASPAGPAAGAQVLQEAALP